MIYSMTGFSRIARQTDVAQFTIELKAVNHRFLDINTTLPDGFSHLDLLWRNHLKENLARGRIECYLKIQWYVKPQQGLPIDEPLLNQLLKTLSQVNEQAPNINLGSAVDVLKWPGVINPELRDTNGLQKAITEALHEALEILINMRQQEGEQIKAQIMQRIESISEFVSIIRTQLPQLIDQQQKKLIKKFEDAKVQLDPERLAQEMVIYAQRIDVAEELDRLTIHLTNVKKLLIQGGRIGRKLDFMMQELNREANTLGSKSFSAEITQIVVNIKVCIEEMREQIQNIE